MTSPSVPTAGPEPDRPDTATKTARRSEESALEIEQFTIAQIPEDQRHGRPRDLFTIWFTSNLIPLAILTGALATVTFTLPFWPAVLAILLGNLVGGLFMALHSAQGPRLGVPQMIQSRAQYGTIGALLVVGVVVFMYLGFFASNMILGGQALNQLISGISVDWGIVISGLGSLVIVVFGYNMIHGLNRWLAIVFGVVMVMIVILTVAHGLPAHFFSLGKFTWAAFVSAAVTTGVLWQIAYAPYVSDYSRYMSADKGVRPTFWFSYWGVVLGSAGPMIIGALVGLAANSDDLVAEINKLCGGFGWVVMLVFVVGIMDSNSINAYGAMLCSITCGQTFHESWLPRARTRIVITAVFVAVCIFLALAYQSTFLTSYYNFILFLLYLLVPWTAINLVDFYLVRHGHYDVPSFFRQDGGEYGRFQWQTVLIYLIGFAVEIPFINTTFYEGPIAQQLNGTDISWLVGLAVTVPLYYFSAVARGLTKPSAVANATT
jgi:NCS1 family nucleobase:cation symporter-1